jgi:hypothetical protein
MRYHGVYTKIAVVIYLNEKKWCQSLGDWGYPVFKTLRSSALRCCQLQQLKSIRPVSGHDACGALALLSLFTEVSFWSKGDLAHFEFYAFQFFPWILWLSEKLHIARGWKLEWLLIAASRRCALKAGMGNEWITLFWWKKPQCLALKHLLISITPKIARRFSLLLTHGVLFQLVYEERGGVVFRHRHMMAIVLRFKSPKWWITIKGYTTLSILLWW